jgi:hypothetical protein
MTFPEFNENGDLPVIQLFVEDWQIKDDKTRRGIVEVSENDKE